MAKSDATLKQHIHTVQGFKENHEHDKGESQKNGNC